jgi:hypothetical protein
LNIIVVISTVLQADHAARSESKFVTVPSVPKNLGGQQRKIALGNDTLVGFAPALDAILDAFTVRRPQPDDLIVPACCRSRNRGDELDSLSDLELVGQARHCKASLRHVLHLGFHLFFFAYPPQLKALSLDGGFDHIA